jgi:hypothetical protein
MQVTYGGTELNRGGFVSMGVVPSEVLLAAAHTTDQLAGCCPNNIRMPESMCEIKWRPGSKDEEWASPNLDVGPDAITGHTSLLVAFRGVPVGTVFRLRLVCVYEVVQSFNLGYVVNLTTPKANSRNTVAHVLQALDKFGNWAWEVGHNTVKAIDVATGLYRVAKEYGNTASYIGSRVAPLLLGA